MNPPKIYMITCDTTSHLLKPIIPIFDKYWNIEKTVIILGYNKPDVVLPSDYRFISMKPQQVSLNDWGRDIAEILENETDDYVIFTLDDYMGIDYINVEIFNKLCTLIENDDKVARCALGIDIVAYQPYNIIENCDGYQIVEQTQDSIYRITAQPAIWNRKHLVSMLKNSTDPWCFENNNRASGLRVIGTKDKYCYRWIEESIYSTRYSSNKINILGMRPSDVRWCIENNLLNENDLQYGAGHVGYSSLRPTNVPQFKDYKYDFKVEVLQNFISKQAYDIIYMKYKTIYG